MWTGLGLNGCGCGWGFLYLQQALGLGARAGEDVGHYGGSYKCTLGLYKKYGDLRVLDTPICGGCRGLCHLCKHERLHHCLPRTLATP